MDIRFFVKLLISVCIIIFCTQIGKKMPALAGLIATAPITSLIVLLWLYSDSAGRAEVMTEFTTGVLWGIIPTVLFFVTAYICFVRGVGIVMVLAASSAVWLIAAVVHQVVLSK